MIGQKRLFYRYFGIAIIINVILPVILSLGIIGDRKGEIQLLYIGVGAWALIHLFLYSIYFAVPFFKKDWEKYGGIALPSIISIWILFNATEIEALVIAGINILLVLSFMIHFNKSHIKTRS